MVMTEEKFLKVSPLDGSVLTEVVTASPDSIARVVRAARVAQEAWAGVPLPAKSKILITAAEIMKSRSDEFVDVVRMETGKPRRLARGEIDAAVDMAYQVASYGRYPSGYVAPSAIAGRQILVERVPYGVAALIVSYNTPLPNYAWKVFPSVMAGNASILKPSPHTPVSARLFVDVLREAGIPSDICPVVEGGAAAVDSLISSGVDLVSFTGGGEAGRAIASNPHLTLTKVILEMGGANPLFVFPDADLDRAVDAALESAYSNAGQRCASASRLILHHSVAEDFLVRFHEKARQLTWGLGDDVDVSTLIDARSAALFEQFLEDCVSNGATVKRLGEKSLDPRDSDALVQPALIESLPHEGKSATREIFGPATRVFEFSTPEEAISLANASELGLTAAIWTKDFAFAQEFARKVPAGVININGPTHGAEINIPFGGVKDSGNGTRDAGFEAVLEYSDTRVVSTFHS